MFLRRLWTRFTEGAERRPADAEGYLREVRALAREGEYASAVELCREGLEQFQGNGPLHRLAREVRQAERGARRQALLTEVATAPTDDAYRELCELMFKRGEAAEALEHARSWRRSSGDGEATYYEAAAHGELFFSSLRSQDGIAAFRLAAEAGKALKDDPRPYRLQFEISRRCGAWEDARSALARLLDLMPGNRLIEGRFRGVIANCANSRSLPKALADVERAGRFLDDEPLEQGVLDREAVRPGLQELAARAEVHVAFLLRGNTALVQGAQGAAADRSARSVRDIQTTSRSSARKLGLGSPVEVRCEGSAGSLVLRTGAGGTAAVWAARMLTGTSGKLMDQLANDTGLTEEAA